MSENHQNTKHSWGSEIGNKEQLKLRSRNERKHSVWSGLGLFGMVGWSVVVPTLLGTLLGKWLDNVYKQGFSWTLTLLLGGLFLGCVFAWTWIKKEHTEMHDKSDEI